QCLLENIQILADLVDRFEKAFHVLEKCKDHTCSDGASEAQESEIRQDQRNRQNTDHADCGPQKQSVELYVFHIVLVVHFVDLLKFIPEPLLLVEDLDDLHALNTFCKFCIQVTEKLSRMREEIGGIPAVDCKYQYDGRHEHERKQCQFEIQHKHHDETGVHHEECHEERRQYTDEHLDNRLCIIGEP